MSVTDKIFINLPVTDLARATAFYEGIGGVKNPMFSDEKASCIVLSDSIHVMLLTRDFFQTFAPGRTIVDPQAMVSAAYAFVVESRAAADALVERAPALGGVADINPAQDHGFMYSRSMADPDGHIWEPFWMDSAAAANGPQAAESAA